MSEIVLYASRYSRSFCAFFMLEELGVPYRIDWRDIARREHKAADFLAINSMGKVPALTDGAVTVAENPAIAIYLADRYSPGDLAPALDDPARGAWLRWIVFTTAVFEPAVYLDEPQDARSASGRGWGERAAVIRTLDAALTHGQWLLGERFTAADVVLGSHLSVALYNRRIAEPPASFAAYNARLEARPAYKRAAELNWPRA